jgi:antimicrobial peptide system SdpA family protein
METVRVVDPVWDCRGANPRRVGIWVLLIGAGFALPGVYSLHAGLPPNAITLPFAEYVDASKWAPQGWGFFTRDAREQQVLPFVWEKGWKPANLGPHAQLRYAFGLNRRSRAQGVEMGLLQGQIAAKKWSKCDSEPIACLESLPVSERLKNDSPLPSLCGQVAFVRQEPTPWAWAVEGARDIMPAEIVKMEVLCSSK